MMIEHVLERDDKTRSGKLRKNSKVKREGGVGNAPTLADCLLLFNVSVSVVPQVRKATNKKTHTKKNIERKMKKTRKASTTRQNFLRQPGRRYRREGRGGRAGEGLGCYIRTGV